MGADDGDMPSSSSRLVVVAQSGHHKKSLRVGDVLDDHRRHITDLKEIAEPLEGFQQNEKSQAGHFAASDPVGERNLLSGRRVHGGEFIWRRTALQSRIDRKSVV